MPLKTTAFDAAEYLRTPAQIEVFLEPQPDDTSEVRAHLAEIAERAQMLWQIAPRPDETK